MSDIRRAVVEMVNILGCPRACPNEHCEGCAFEHEEATLVGLIALGYLKEELVLVADGHPRFYERHLTPDPKEAWDEFMKIEYDAISS